VLADCKDGLKQLQRYFEINMSSGLVRQSASPLAPAFTRQLPHQRHCSRLDKALVRVQVHAASSSGNATHLQPVRIATRGSPLAIVQAEQVAALLHAAWVQQHATQASGLAPPPQLVVMAARGDQAGMYCLMLRLFSMERGPVGPFYTATGWGS
jgi:hypothetical protein